MQRTETLELNAPDLVPRYSRLLVASLLGPHLTLIVNFWLDGKVLLLFHLDRASKPRLPIRKIRHVHLVKLCQC